MTIDATGFDSICLLVGRITVGIGFIYGAVKVVEFLVWWWGLVEDWWPKPFSLGWLFIGFLGLLLLWVVISFVGSVLMTTYQLMTEKREE